MDHDIFQYCGADGLASASDRIEHRLNKRSRSLAWIMSGFPRGIPWYARAVPSYFMLDTYQTVELHETSSRVFSIMPHSLVYALI